MHACGGTNNCATAIQRFSGNRSDRREGHRGVDAVTLIAASYRRERRLDYSEAIIHFPKTREVGDSGVARQQRSLWRGQRSFFGEGDSRKQRRQWTDLAPESVDSEGLTPLDSSLTPESTPNTRQAYCQMLAVHRTGETRRVEVEWLSGGSGRRTGRRHPLHSLDVWTGHRQDSWNQGCDRGQSRNQTRIQPSGLDGGLGFLWT